MGHSDLYCPDEKAEYICSEWIKDTSPYIVKVMSPPGSSGYIITD